MSKELIVVPHDWYKSLELQRIKRETTQNMILTADEAKKSAQAVKNVATTPLITTVPANSSASAIPTTPIKTSSGKSTRKPSIKPKREKTSTSGLAKGGKIEPSSDVTSGDEETDWQDAESCGQNFATPIFSTPRKGRVTRDDVWRLFKKKAIRGDKLLKRGAPDKTRRISLDELQSYLFDTSGKTQRPAGLTQVVNWFRTPDLSRLRNQIQMNPAFEILVAPSKSPTEIQSPKGWINTDRT